MNKDEKVLAFRCKYGITNIRAARFWIKVDKSGPGGCWLWTGQMLRGYGRWKPCNEQTRIRNGYAKIISSHRVAYGLATGEEPEVVMHMCDNPACVNPAHLKGGSQAENNFDMRDKGRAHHACGSRNGHTWLTEYDVLQIRGMYASGMRVEDIARKYGLARMSTLSIARGRKWKHVGGVVSLEARIAARTAYNNGNRRGYR